MTISSNLKAAKSSEKAVSEADKLLMSRLHNNIKLISIDNKLSFENSSNIIGGNFSFLESITPNCMGFIGFDFFKGYLFKLDYLNQTITFYKNSESRQKTKDFLIGEKVVGCPQF